MPLYRRFDLFKSSLYTFVIFSLFYVSPIWAQTLSAEQIEHNVYNGFSAPVQTHFVSNGFSSLRVDDLPLFELHTDKKGNAVESYRSHANLQRIKGHDPSNGFILPLQINGPSSELLKFSFRWVAVIPMINSTGSPFKADVIFFGEDGPVLRFDEFDFRRLLHQHQPTNNACLEKLQLWLGEFERRSMRVPVPINSADATLASYNPLGGVSTGWPDYLPSGQQLYVNLTNNCREPGNFEFDFEIVDTDDDVTVHSLSTYAFFPPSFIEALMIAYSGVSPFDAGTGMSYATIDENGRADYHNVSTFEGRPIERLFPDCHANELLTLAGINPNSPLRRVRSVNNHADDPILPANKETAYKMGFDGKRAQSLAYWYWEDTDFSVPMFERIGGNLLLVRQPVDDVLSHRRDAHYEEIVTEMIGHAPRNAQPMIRFAQVWTARSDSPRVRFSAFTEAGIYAGSPELQPQERPRDTDKWRYDFELGYLARWATQVDDVEVRLTDSGGLHIVVRDSERKVNFVGANLGLLSSVRDDNKPTDHLLGFATTPLVFGPERQNYQTTPFVGVLVDDQGRVLNQHEYGVAKVLGHIERVDNKTVGVSLAFLSFERVMPIYWLDIVVDIGP